MKEFLQKFGWRETSPADLEASEENIQVYLAGCTFSGGQTLELANSDIVVIVGPNNSGKSAALRNILQQLGNPERTTEVITRISSEICGSEEDLSRWISKHCYTKDQRINHLGQHAYTFSHVRDWTNSKKNGLGDLADLFCVHITVEMRLSATSNIILPDTLSEGDSHPAQKLYRESTTAERLSKLFFKAFNEHLIVNPRSGSRLRIHITPSVADQPAGSKESDAWIRELSSLPLLEYQGDGMKSFFSVLLYTTTLESKILLLDEPEAFLHPPQARLLGELLPEIVSKDKQLFIATHSGDIIRGLLNTKSPRVKVVSVRRPTKSTNVATFLNNNDLLDVWKDPLLRSSNLIEGLFHEKVILCESDGDCRFYQAITEALEPRLAFRASDILFTHCNGKSRIHVAVRALRKLGVPLRVIVDFDIIQDGAELKRIYVESGGNWTDISSLHQKVLAAIEACLGAQKINDARQKINAALDKAGGFHSILTDTDIDRVKEILNGFSPWRQAKTTGRSILPNGEATQCFNELVRKLKEHDVFIVEEGELESFARSVSKSRKAIWLDSVLKKDLGNDPELREAREYVFSVLMHQ